jgi:hypothetical protein
MRLAFKISYINVAKFIMMSPVRCSLLSLLGEDDPHLGLVILDVLAAHISMSLSLTATAALCSITG